MTVLRPSRCAIGIVAAFAVAATSAFGATAASAYTKPPADKTSGHWYWQIGGGTLPAMTGSGAAATANIWDTDYFTDASSTGGDGNATGASSVVTKLHASGKYSICYVEAGAFQTGFPDDSNFASADYGGQTKTHQMKGWAGEWWFDLKGFSGWSSASPTKFPGGAAADQTAAANIAAGLTKRIAGCHAEGQDGLEPDDLDGYTNKSASGGKGGGWGLTQTDSAGFEKWLSYEAHANDLAIFQKNDTDNIAAVESVFDGAITEECNYYKDPCSEWNSYVAAGKPVLNAEYTSDSETTAKFCSKDAALGIAGSLFDLNLDGKKYTPCRTT